MQETLSYKPGSLLRLFEEKNLQMGNIRHYKYVSKICLTRFISPPTMKIIISLMRKNLKKLKVAYTFYYFPKTSPTVYPQYLLNHWRFALLPRLSKHLKVLKGEANFSYLKEFKNLLELDISTLEKKTKIPLFLTKLKTLDINNLQNSSSSSLLLFI